MVCTAGYEARNPADHIDEFIRERSWKGGQKMRSRKVLGIVVLLAITLVSIPVYHSYGGKPPIEGRIGGPEVTGVAIIDFAKQVAMLRVKMEVKGQVKTQAVNTCSGLHRPSSETEVLYYRLDGVTLLGIPGTPIITGIENFKREGDIVSFDVRFQFWIDKEKK